jgi:hypothetical protein
VKISLSYALNFLEKEQATAVVNYEKNDPLNVSGMV